MRNKDRIKPLLETLEKYWLEYPDLRLGQIIANISYQINKQNDPFYIEDTVLLDYIKKELDKIEYMRKYDLIKYLNKRMSNDVKN